MDAEWRIVRTCTRLPVALFLGGIRILVHAGDVDPAAELLDSERHDGRR
jgi:hypothetical protein